MLLKMKTTKHVSCHLKSIEEHLHAVQQLINQSPENYRSTSKYILLQWQNLHQLAFTQWKP